MINRVGEKLSILFCLFSYIALFYILGMRSESWECKFYNKILAFCRYELPPDLTQYEKRLECNLHGKQPDNVLLILGESFSKSHSSLYGYNNKTNPYLEGLVQDSLLFVFENAISPATTTIPSIQSILSTYNPNIKSDLKWYECTTLINMMKSAGYETTWISNQSPKGMYDNTAARYAELCDSIVWVGSKFTGISKKDYDELLVNTLCEIDFNDESKHFVVIHMMGSHCDFKDRYPEEWSIFDEMDYDYLPINQKSIIASYDNSILYNDYVVSQILNLFYDKESIAFYFPDHGLDVYESTDDYCGHAIQDSEDSKKVAKRIPFVVYCSPEFSDEFSVAVERIKASRKGEYCTSDVKTLIMDCIGAEILSSNL